MRGRVRGGGTGGAAGVPQLWAGRRRRLGMPGVVTAVGLGALGLVLLLAGPSAAGAPVAAPAAVDPAPAAGAWVWPVAGPRVVRPFDRPATRYSAGHRGADVGAAVGTVVHAAGAGRVAYAGLLAGRGVVVVVHGELRTTYEPVAATVRVGAVVAMGAPLGVLTSGGHCLAGCLHWGLLRGDEYLDPVRLVRRGPSILLPVPGAADIAGGGPAALRRDRLDAAPAATPDGSADAAAAPPQPAAEPSFSLRAAEAPWGVGALLALVLGLLLLRRPVREPPPPEPPVSASAALPVPVLLRAPHAAADLGDDPVDLAAERARRRRA